MESPQGLGIVS